MEFLSAGVFTEEVPSGESAVLGVSTSNFATVGWLPRGEENKAILVTSLADYFRKFGSYWKNSDVPLAMTAFFKNDGARAFVVRVTPSDAVTAEKEVTGKWLIKAISKGAWGNLVRTTISGNKNYYDFATATYSKFDITVSEESVDGANDFGVIETFEAVELVDQDSAQYFSRVINDDQSGSGEIRVSAIAGGIPTAFNPSAVSGETIGTGTGLQQLFTTSLVQPEIAAFTLQIKVAGNLVATDDGRGKLQMQSGVSGFTGVSGTIAYTSGALAINFTPAVGTGEAISADYVKKGVDSLSYDLVGGADGTSVSRSEVSDPALEASEKGLYALNKIDEMLNIGLPDFPGNEVVQLDMISYCENRGDCFAILDTRRGIDSQDAKNYKQVTLGSMSDYGAIYWPGIKVADPLMNGKLKAISPVGHVAGVYARTDNTRNVGKAPAGTVDGRLNFCVALENATSQGDRDLIYPANVNPLVSDTSKGRAVWGARTLAISGDYTLVATRRLFIFLRKSTFNNTQDLVFESIGAELFTIVTARMGAFLENLTQQGYFASRISNLAYKVVCDESNNTPATILARQLITDVYCATQVPGEFIRFRFQRMLTTQG